MDADDPNHRVVGLAVVKTRLKIQIIRSLLAAHNFQPPEYQASSGGFGSISGSRGWKDSLPFWHPIFQRVALSR